METVVDKSQLELELAEQSMQENNQVRFTELADLELALVGGGAGGEVSFN